MIVNIHLQENTTLIIFKGKDLTNFNEILRIANSIAAGSYCFEANSLLSHEFQIFMRNIKPKMQYVISVGLDRRNKPSVSWGKLKRKKIGDSPHSLWTSCP